MFNLEEIFKNGPQDIQERLDIITNTINGIIKVQNELQSQGHWCSQCGRWYYKTDCDILKEEHERMVCINPWDGYLDRYEYEMRLEKEWYDICPKGHKLSSKPRFKF